MLTGCLFCFVHFIDSAKRSVSLVFPTLFVCLLFRSLFGSDKMTLFLFRLISYLDSFLTL